jgi:hypothetical protein
MVLNPADLGHLPERERLATQVASESPQNDYCAAAGAGVAYFTSVVIAVGAQTRRLILLPIVASPISQDSVSAAAVFLSTEPSGVEAQALNRPAKPQHTISAPIEKIFMYRPDLLFEVSIERRVTTT